MTVISTRPDAAELVFRVYQRGVHPELLAIRAEIGFLEGPFTCVARLHDGGHSIEFRHRKLLLTEIVSSRTHPLPQNHLCVDHRLRGSRNTSRVFPDGLRYESCLQAERLDDSQFQNYHLELQVDARKATLACEIPGSSRLANPAISLLRVEFTNSSLLVHAFHTYPDNSAVVKTQTLFEIGE